MKRSVLARIAVTLMAIAGMSLCSQTQTQNQPPSPAKSRSDEMLDRWNAIGNKLVAMAQDFPEDKYDFKLQKDERTFALNLLHAAALDFVLIRRISGSNVGPDFGEGDNPSRDAFKTKADVVKFVQEAVADGAQVIQQAGRRGAGQNVEILWEPAGSQLHYLDVCHRAQRRALRPACRLLPCQQYGPAGFPALRRPVVFDRTHDFQNTSQLRRLALMRQLRILFLPALFIFAVVAVLISPVSVSGQQATSGSNFPADIVYAQPGQLVSVNGFRLNVYCMGSGSPTVVFDSGWGDWAAPASSKVQPEIAKWTRACSYDGAGTGFSDPGPMPRTSVHIAEELRTALHHAGIGGPYILVGSAFGSDNVRTFADLYMGEVAGLVLVDADSTDVEPKSMREEEHRGHAGIPSGLRDVVTR